MKSSSVSPLTLDIIHDGGIARRFAQPMLCSLLMGVCVLFAGSTRLHAASGTWVNSTDNLWSDTASWLNGIIADGAGNTATFSNEAAAAVTVNLDSSRTIGGLQFVQGTYTITNNGVVANALTLAGTSKPGVFVPAGTTATLRGTVLAGTDGFILDGGGTLALFKQAGDPANTITGDVILNAGSILNPQEGNTDFNVNDLALDSLGSFTFMGGTLNLLSDASTGLEYGTVDNNLIVPDGQAGTIILPPRFSGAGDNSTAPGTGLGGTLTGSGILNLVTRYVRPNIPGDWSAFTGQINVTPGSTGADNEWCFGSSNAFPNAFVDLGGTSPLAMQYYVQPATDGSTVLRVGLLTGANPTAYVTGSSIAGRTLNYRIGRRQTNATDVATYAGRFDNGAGPLALVWEGAGTWAILGTNTHSGGTTISNGVLQIGDGISESGTLGAGPVTNWGRLVINRAGAEVMPNFITGSGSLSNIGVGCIITLTGTNNYTGPTVVTAGRLIVGTASRVTSAYTIGDSAGFGALMGTAGAALTVSSLNFSSASTFDFDFGNFAASTAALVTNTGNLALNGDITVNVAGPSLTVGTITLLQYGSRSGSGNFVLGTVPPQVTGFTFNDDTVNKRVTLTITATFDSTLKWEGGTAGVWDIDNVANKIWRVLGSGQLTNYYDGAKVLFDDTATGTNFVEIQGAVSPASIRVNNSTKPYTFGGSGSINGNGVLTKEGSHQLTLTTLNSYAGATRVDAGTLELGDGFVEGSVGTGVITNHGMLVIRSAAGMTLANPVHGSGQVVQAGPGVATLTGASTYSGGLTLKPGTTLAYNNGNAAGIGGGLRIEAATLTLGAGVFNNVGTITVITNAIFQNTGANQVVDVPIVGTNVIITFDKTPNLITLNRDLSGISGIITNLGTGLLRFNSGGGNNATGSANALWVFETVGGWLQARNTSVNFLGAVTGVGTLGASQSGNNTTVTWTLGGLNTSTEFAGTINDGLAFATPNATRHTALTKVGTGTLTLNNATLAYRSPTTVSNGTLALVGTSSPDLCTNLVVVAPGILSVAGRADGTLTLGAGTNSQTLRGDGTVTGNIVLGSLGRLEPGFSAGTLTVSGSATLGGTTVMELTTAGGAASDRLVAANINYGNGTLILTNLGNITGSNVFRLFSGNLSGAFANVITPTLSGVTWDLSQLNGSGIVTLVGPPGVSTTPTNLAAIVSGSQLDLQWPASHTGWALQTNAVDVGNPSHWHPVAGSTTTNRMVLTIDAAQTNVFYRLRFAP